jgi:hypothetical protein
LLRAACCQTRHPLSDQKKRAASNIENATFRAKVIAKAQRLALAAIRAGR